MDPLLLQVLGEMRDDVRRLESKMDDILAFKWKVVGSAMAITGLVTVLFHVLEFVIYKK